MKKIAFVVPWHGENIPGGAEAALRDITNHLFAASWDIEILTTTVKQFTADWNVDFYPEGLTEVYGIPVRRFKIRKRDVDKFNRSNLKLMKNIPLSDYDWVIGNIPDFSYRYEWPLFITDAIPNQRQINGIYNEVCLSGVDFDNIVCNIFVLFW